MSGGLALETDRSGCNQPDVDMQLDLDMEVEKREESEMAPGLWLERLCVVRVAMLGCAVHVLYFEVVQLGEVQAVAGWLEIWKEN